MATISPKQWLLAVALAGTAPIAHAQAAEASGFLTGFVHPISGLDHVFAMIAVGMWAQSSECPRCESSPRVVCI